MPYPIYFIGHISRSIWKKLSRKGIRALFFLPDEKRTMLERWWRGREECRKLRLADCVIVSFGKSGRTWLRMMLSRVYQLKHELPERSLIGFDNLHYQNREIPKIFFTHDNYIKDYTGNWDSKADFYNKKVILLVRDPRDIAVSQFFQWKYRMKPVKKAINKYPEDGEDVSMFEFIMGQDAGLPKVIDYLNLWAKELPRIDTIMIVRYEDLRENTQESLRQIMAFIGTPATEEQLRDAVEYTAFDKMKEMEERKVFWLSGGRMVPKDRNNPNSYKVRRAKVGGYRDYFEDEEIAQLEELVSSTLSPVFKYTDKEQTILDRQPVEEPGSATA